MPFAIADKAKGMTGRFHNMHKGGERMPIYKLKPSAVSSIAPLFAGWEESLVWSCLQGCMGEAWADRPEEPKSARIILGDFCYLSGKVNPELVKEKPGDRESDFIIMVPSQYGCKDWADEIERIYGENCKRVERYAIKKEPGIFNREHLTKIIDRLPAGYEVKLIDEEIFSQTRELSWAVDFTAQFADYEDYCNRGLGAAVLKDGALVSGASSYSVYKGGIEVEIGTQKDCRRRGLASACGAKLILECMERNLYPSWDAQNKWSVALAEKLGYYFDRAYPAYEVYKFGKGKR